jgi:hypothetical protein
VGILMRGERKGEGFAPQEYLIATFRGVVEIS